MHLSYHGLDVTLCFNYYNLQYNILHYLITYILEKSQCLETPHGRIQKHIKYIQDIRYL